MTLWRWLSGLLRLSLGTWSPPAWLRAVGRGLRPIFAPVVDYGRRRPWSALATVVFLGVALLFGRLALIARAHRPPSPLISQIQVSTLRPMTLGDNQKPVPLSLTFLKRGLRSSVAKLSMIGTTVAQGIEVSPRVEGVWTWTSDSELTFQPAADWPIGKTLSIQLAPELFGPQVKLESSVVTVKTPLFTAHLVSAEFYQDPREPKGKRILATVSFSHPVDSADLPQHLKLFYTRAAGGLGKGATIPFALKYDRWKGEAYLQSDPLPIPDQDTAVQVALESGARAQAGGPAAKGSDQRTALVPGISNFFRITGLALNVADGPQGEVQQILTVTASTEVLESVMRGAVSAVLLPKTHAPDDPQATSWPSAEEIGDAVVEKLPKVELTALPTEQEASKVIHFRFQAPVDRWLLVRVKGRIESFGGYPLAKGFAETRQVPPFPAMLSIQGSGAVLSLAGEKRVSLVARQLDAIHVDLLRVLLGEVNHLITQTEGSFAKPAFRGYSFAPENIAERFSEVLPLVEAAPGNNQYAAFDFSKYVGGAAPRRGLFFLKATAWDPVEEKDLDTEDDRFVLVTDLGLVAKKNADGSRDLYAMRLQSGQPASAAKVEVLGRNGVAVAQATTDSQGHVHFADLSKLEREREPVVYLATLGEDLSFLAVDRDDRRLNFSRFDVGGVRDSVDPGALQAYLFSDRGLYRPGDAVHVAAIVKQRDWSKSLVGVPLRWVVEDPRSSALLEKRVKLSGSGFEELTFTTNETSPTGSYTASLYTLPEDWHNGTEGSLVGQVTVRVEEFLPDRLRITSHFVTEAGGALSGEALEGWVKPSGLSAAVEVRNLFGTAAENRRVSARLTLSPQPPAFRRYPDFVFYDPSFDPKNPRQPATEELAEAHTDQDGRTVLPLPLVKFAPATYRLAFTADAFEAEGGRAVTTQSSVLVSPFDYLIGLKPDGDLSFLDRGSRHTVQALAVDSQLGPHAVEGLEAVLIEERWVSVLTEQANGTFRYVSTLKEVTLGQRPLSLAAKPTPVELETKQPGNFVLSVRDQGGREVARLRYGVAGQSNLSRSLERNAELTIKLDRKDYAAGDVAKVSITAPYSGAGLITIERDRVYSAHWFHTDYTSSVQEVAVPKELEGNGYVNVSFVRALDSKEVFMSPLSTGVAPFSVSRAARTNTVTLRAPALVKPGEPLEIGYQVNHPGRIVVFGVDEGILQVARYRTPDPLAYFFRKRALQVDTSQILDQLLPEFSRLVQASAAGGDESAAALGKNLNPFKRKRDKPVAFWSGILDVGGAGAGTYRTQIPDTFNGQIRLMAVAVSEGTVGAQSTAVTVRGPFVLSPNVPSFVAPGDEFQISVGVANNVQGSGPNAPVSLTLAVEGGLEILDGAERKLTIGEGRETSATYRLRATSKLGSAGLTFVAQDGGVRAQIRTDTSVRPAIPYAVTVRGGVLEKGKAELPHDRRMYPEDRKLEARASRLPLALAGGLADYLRDYPYGCTEQIVSQAFPALVLQDRPEFGYSAQTVESSLERAYQVLGERQNGDGAFGMWAANSFVSSFQNAYAADFLTEAQEREQGAPRGVLTRSLAYLATLDEEPVRDLADGRDHAYALYVLSRNGKQVGGAAAALQKRLEALSPQAWKTDLAAAYLAATYKLLAQNNLAEDLVSGLALGQGGALAFDSPDHILDPLARDGQLLFLLSRHFPDRLKTVRPARLQALADALGHGLNSFSAASAMLGFDGLARQMLGDIGANNLTPQVAEVLAAGPKTLALGKGLFPAASFDDAATAIRFEDASGLGLFYGVTEAGFDLAAASGAVSHQLEVAREFRIGGKKVTSAKLGETVEVHLRARALDAVVYNVAIVDLLPAGFEVVVEHPAEPASRAAPQSEPSGEPPSAQAEPSDQRDSEPDELDGAKPASPAGMAAYFVKSGTLEVNSADVREDRVLIFATVPPDARDLVYQIRATNQGTVQVPPLLARSMYDARVEAWSTGDHFEVTAP